MRFEEDESRPVVGEREGASADVPNQADESCVLIGAAKSGKTQFVMAAARACESRVAGQPTLVFVGKTEKSRELLLRAADALRDGELAGTTGSDAVEFEVSAYKGGDINRMPWKKADLKFHDSEGELLFTSGESQFPEITREVVADAKKATCIILCVDMDGDQLQLYRHLAGRLDEMSVLQEFRRQPRPDEWRDMLQGAWHDATHMSLRRLNCDRFLVLLTKADQSAALGTQTIQTKKSVGATMNFAAKQLAEMISPVEQARHVLGLGPLNTIRNRLKPGAQLAVGVCSAGGFDLDGSPFLDAQGKVVHSYFSDVELLQRWTPFGVREAMQFAAFGIHKHSARVEIVHAEQLEESKVGNTLIASTLPGQSI